MKNNFKEIYNDSLQNPEDFWKNISEDVFWFKKPSKILNKSNPPFYKWFEDGVTNTCYNALDLHIDRGRGDKTALIYDSPITGNKAKLSFNALSTKGRYSTVLPGSNPHEAVIKILALLSSILLANSFDANPPKTTE